MTAPGYRAAVLAHQPADRSASEEGVPAGTLAQLHNCRREDFDTCHPGNRDGQRLPGLPRNVDSLGELTGTPRATAGLAQDAPAIELHLSALTR